MIKSFSKALVKHIEAGAKQVDDATRQNRLKICENCEHNQFHLLFRNKCRLCGCKISLKTKWAEQSCPIQRW